MEFKKIFIFICLIICLFSIASVCASDVNQTVVSSDEINQELNLCDADELSVSSEMNLDDSIKTSSDVNVSLSLNDNDEVGDAKESTTIVASDFTTTYDKSDFLKVTLKDSQNNPISNAILIVNLDDSTKNYKTNNNGEINIPTSNLNAKTYDVSIDFAGDEKYTPSNSVVKIIVNKIDSSLNDINNLNLSYEDVAEMSVGANWATGITAKIDGNDVNVSGMKIFIPQLDVGNHILSVTTIPDDNHNPVTKTAIITVNKVKSSVSLKDVTLDYGSTSNLNMSSDGAINIIAKIDGKDVSVNGNTISVSGLDAGTHILSITTVPDDNHVAVTETATITVNKIDSAIGIRDLTLDYGSSSNITVTTVGATKFTAKIDGQSVSVVGNVIIVPTNLDVGTHTLSVTTVPDSNHNSVTKTATITVKKVDSTMYIPDKISLTYGESYNLNVNVDDSAKFTAKIDGQSVAVVGTKIIFPKLDVGTHTLTVEILKDANHDSVTETSTITVKKAKTNVITHNSNATLGQKITLTAGMGGVEQINEGVMIFYDGQTKIGQTTVKNSIAQMTYTPSIAGDHSIIVYYEGTSRYDSSSSTFTLTVLDKSSSSNSTVINNNSIIIAKSQDGNVPLKINLSDDATGTITLSINGKVYKANVVNGRVNVKLVGLDEGVYQYTIAYSGDENYPAFNHTSSLKVIKPDEENMSSNSKINITFPTLDGISSGDHIKMDLPNDATGNVTLIINGETFEFPVENGNATVVIPRLDAGNYPYTLTYSGDSKYSSFSRQGTIVEVVKVDPVITASNVNVVYTAGTYYTIEVTGTDGKPADGAAVIITGKISKTIKTDNGVAKFKISQVPGQYKIKITALGKSVTRTINVKHLVTLKAVSVKKSAKKLVLQATLGKVNGKYLNKKSVTFKFNGKTYKAKTDKKGVAKVTITSNVLKKLKVGKTVTYQATYLKDTIKKTAKIKK